MSLLDGLSAYWKFNEGSGTTTADSSGNNLNGTLNGPTWSADAPDNGANLNLMSLNFAPLSGINVSIAPCSLGALKEFTISAWFKTQDVTLYQSIFSASNGGLGFFAGLYAHRVFLQNNTTYLGVGNLISDSNWHLMTVTYDGINGKTYLDSALGQTGALPVPNTYNGNIYISTYNGTTAYFNGNIDEVGVWDRALSQDEITALYNSGAGFSYPFTTYINLGSKAISKSSFQSQISITKNLFSNPLSISSASSYLIGNTPFKFLISHREANQNLQIDTKSADPQNPQFTNNNQSGGL